ncbi:MAG: ParB/RepB/Spo0J family partition protein [Alphaproteobacteria bacterium]|nr:ParB/RepB/Spo0J family partition protein [Alphaproteobacteria bacterium]
MRLEFIELNQLKDSPINVRQHGGEDVSDLVPSIRSLGVIQSLLVRPNCEGFEVVAGQRRRKACQIIAEQDGGFDPLPCIVLEDGDDAKAIEASLAENIARLPMDEVDQYKAFAALRAQGRSIEDIAAHFGVTERLVSQRLAIANLHPPILNAYRSGDITADTMRTLTMASKSQQKAWFKRFRDPKDRAPTGKALKAWLFGGADIPVSHALFPLEAYGGKIIGDLFGDEQFFDDAGAFWKLQMEAVIERQQRYLENGWSDVLILEDADYFGRYDKVKRGKKDGGKVYIQCRSNGEVEFHEGWLDEKDAKRLDRAAAKAGGEVTAEPKPELTKAAIRYCDLHRHNAVRAELLKAPAVALRLMVAHAIAGSPLWTVEPETQKSYGNAVIDESIKGSTAQEAFAQEREAVGELLQLDDERRHLLNDSPFGSRHDLAALFARLLQLDDGEVMRVLAFVMGESLSAGSVIVEALGHILKVDMAAWWEPDQAFFDLLRDKAAINAMVAEVAGKRSAKDSLTKPAAFQKDIIRGFLEGRNGSPKPEGWLPRYMRFPMQGYTKRQGLPGVAQGKEAGKLFASAS